MGDTSFTHFLLTVVCLGLRLTLASCLPKLMTRKRPKLRRLTFAKRDNPRCFFSFLLRGIDDYTTIHTAPLQQEIMTLGSMNLTF